MSFSPEQIRWIVQALIILLLSICVHEWGHAWVADKLGDRLPRSQGRVSLNPLRHADPIGTIAFPLIGLLYTGGLGFGWGKPVQVNPVSFSRKFEMRTGHLFVALAGPTMNLALGTVIAVANVLLVKFGVISAAVGDGGPPATMNEVLQYAALLNFTLFFFNLIPAPPLDGGAVAVRFIPYKYKRTYEQIAVYAPFVLLAILMISPLRKIFTVPAGFVQDGVYTGFKAVAQLFV